jgi:Xaa-Pro dipeptidase
LGEVQDLAGYEWPEANINPADLVNELHYHRAIKTDYEIDRLAAANIMAAMGHLAARDAFLAEATEYEIHLAYMAGCKHTEQELPYGNIIALGAHGAILHYTELDKHLPAAEHRQTFLIDAGAVANHYCADITRTWSRDDDFLSLISDFDILQLDLIAEIKPGLSYVELHKLAHLRIAQFMYDHDLISCSAEEAVNNGISATFFPHGLGHLLGLQVHDIGGHQHDISGTIVAPPEQHPFLRLTRNLEVGYCVTIEPGLYFIDLLLEKLKSTAAAKHVNWSLVNTLKPFGGIRIEDDVVVTDYGHENLSRQAFQKLT